MREPSSKQEPSRAARAASVSAAQFVRACAEAQVRDGDRDALWDLLQRWSWSAKTPVERLDELLDDYQHWCLFREGRAGDDGAAREFEAHWRRYARASYGWRLPSHEVEDIVGAFFERCFRLVQPQYPFRSPFTVYLKTVLLNVSRTRGERLQQQRKFESSLEVLEPTALRSKDESPEAAVLRNERARTLELALFRLSPVDRNLLRAVFVDGSSGQEAADLVGLSREAAYKRLQRAKKQLQQMLKQLGMSNDEEDRGSP